MRLLKENSRRPFVFSFVLLLCISSAVFADAASGVYAGNFVGSLSNGVFAGLLRNDNSAIILGFDEVTEEGFADENVSINSDGTFDFIETQTGTSISGSLSSGGVSGDYSGALSGAGTFSGEKSSDTGTFANVGGYYVGRFQAVCNDNGMSGTVSGGVRIILDAAGNMYVLSQDDEGGANAGFLTANSSGNINGILLDGSVVTGKLNMNSFSAVGNFSAPDGSCSGSWNAQRIFPLPGSMSGTFADVPSSYWAYDYIEKLFAAGITKGCGYGNDCPEDQVTRAQMAVFLERGIRGSDFIPMASSGIFSDVALDYWAADWIEQFYQDGITQGCDTGPLRYCPDQPVSRAEMAVFLLRAKYGRSYSPPKATGLFSDVSSGHWAADWVEQLYTEGITTGCGDNPLMFCPDDSVTRAQMAAFLVRTFGLQ